MIDRPRRDGRSDPQCNQGDPGAERAPPQRVCDAQMHDGIEPSTTLADLVYAAILCRDFFGSAGIAEAVA
jgi:hypothetical protein